MEAHLTTTSTEIDSTVDLSDAPPAVMRSLQSTPTRCAFGTASSSTGTSSSSPVKLMLGPTTASTPNTTNPYYSTPGGGAYGPAPISATASRPPSVSNSLIEIVSFDPASPCTLQLAPPPHRLPSSPGTISNGGSHANNVRSSAGPPAVPRESHSEDREEGNSTDGNRDDGSDPRQRGGGRPVPSDSKGSAATMDEAALRALMMQYIATDADLNDYHQQQRSPAMSSQRNHAPPSNR